MLVIDKNTIGTDGIRNIAAALKTHNKTLSTLDLCSDFSPEHYRAKLPFGRRRTTHGRGAGPKRSSSYSGS